MNALEIKNLSKMYAGGVQALKDVSITVEQGDFFALLEPNGAGKNTLIGIVSSLINKTTGKVCVFDANIDLDKNLTRQYLGVVPQEFNFNIFETSQQIVVNQAGYYGIPRKLAMQRSKKYLKQMGLWEKRNVQSQKLSGGMKRRLMIARALIHEPKVLILDEPTAGVDIELRRAMWDSLTQLNISGTTIILTTHYLEEAEQLCRNIAIIDHGKVIQQGSMMEFLSLLQVETLVLNTEHTLNGLPVVAGFGLRSMDDHTLEADIHKGQSINELMAALAKQGITVRSMRNRSNRLEELFLELTQNKVGACAE